MTHAYSITEESRSEHEARVTLVLALQEGWPVVDAQVAALWPHCRRAGAELVVACTAAASQLAAARVRYAGARFVAAAPGTGVDALRGLGMEAASGDIVALLDRRDAGADAWARFLLGVTRAELVS
jgi:hypothetical protein